MSEEIIIALVPQGDQEQRQAAFDHALTLVMRSIEGPVVGFGGAVAGGDPP